MKQKKPSSLTRILGYAGGHKNLTILGCILSALSAVLGLAPYLCVWLVARSVLSTWPGLDGAGNLGLWGWMAVWTAVGSILLYFAALMSTHIAAFRTARNIRRAAMTHVLKLPLGFFAGNQSGRLRKLIDDNAGLTEDLLAHKLPDLAATAVTPIAAIVVLFLFDWRMGLLCLLTMVLALLSMCMMMGGKNAGFSGNDERENTLNQLLTEMDGFQTNTGVIVLAATNRADILDKALMRAGRFDRQIEVGLPDVKEREEIFNVHLRPLKLDPALDRSFLARQTPGFSGADIANVCNEAALIAARHNKKFISKEDFLAAIDRIVGGLERKNKIITDEEKRVIAYHEAGHATVSWILENASPLIKVTIIPRGKALGAAWYLPEERQITTREQMMDELAATLGGRVSEQLTFGEISTGALNDLERVTKQAYAMVAYYGMSDNVGTLSYYDSTGQSDMAFTKPYSELTAQQIDAETKRVIGEAYAMAERVLTEHADGLKQLAELLLEREVVFTEDVERIFGKRKKDIERERREAGKKAAEGGEPAAAATAATAVAAKDEAQESPADGAASEAKK